MRILGIESSCDETAASVVSRATEDGPLRLESTVVASQGDLHAATGGVVPEVAARAHLAALVPVVREAGGRMTGWSGEPVLSGTSALTTNGLLHDLVLPRLTHG